MLLLIFIVISTLMISVLCGKKKEKKPVSKKPEVAPVSQNSITSTIATPTYVAPAYVPPAASSGNREDPVETKKKLQAKEWSSSFWTLYRKASYTKMPSVNGKGEKKEETKDEKKEEQLLEEMTAVEVVEPKEMGLTKKEEMIKDGKLEPKKKNEYPTFQDIASDWDSEKEKEQKKKDEEKKAQEKKEEKIPPSSAKPKEMALTKKEEMIKEGKIQPKKKNEYPTFQDIASDWDSEKEKEQKKKEEKMKEMDSNQKKEQATAQEPNPLSEVTQFEVVSSPGPEAIKG